MVLYVAFYLSVSIHHPATRHSARIRRTSASCRKAPQDFLSLRMYLTCGERIIPPATPTGSYSSKNIAGQHGLGECPNQSQRQRCSCRYLVSVYLLDDCYSHAPRLQPHGTPKASLCEERCTLVVKTLQHPLSEMKPLLNNRSKGFQVNDVLYVREYLNIWDSLAKNKLMNL